MEAANASKNLWNQDVLACQELTHIVFSPSIAIACTTGILRGKRYIV